MLRKCDLLEPRVYIEWGDKNPLITIIKSEVLQESTLVSDRWQS